MSPAAVHPGAPTGGQLHVVAVHPAPEPEVLSAIMAAVEELWPRPRPVDSADDQGVSAWRFSGRWWSKPTALRRDRPSGR